MKTNMKAERNMKADFFTTINANFLKTDDMAVLPSKVRQSDVGYDLTVIKEHKKFNSRTTLYDTGLKISVKNGFYAEIVPRSSLSKSGYMLANSVAIIDPDYTGNLYIALVKVCDDAEDITLPFRCCQLIFRPHIQANIIEVTDKLTETDRGEKAFGSSGTH